MGERGPTIFNYSMVSFGNSHRIKNPKFALNLEIKELVNIPQSAGVCQVKWSLREEPSSVNEKRTLNKITHHSSLIGGTGSAVSGSTAKVEVSNHRAQWNYKVPTPPAVKLYIDRDLTLMARYLVLEVYLEFTHGNNKAASNQGQDARMADGMTQQNKALDTNPKVNPDLRLSSRTSTSSLSRTLGSGTTSLSQKQSSILSSNNKVYSHRSTGRMLLGVVNINIAEYISEDEQAISNRFLLKNSKVNSILNISLQLHLTRGRYNTFKTPSKISSGQLAGLSLNGNDESAVDDESTFSVAPDSLFSPANATTNKSGGKGKGGSATVSTLSSNMSPLVDALYQQTFQLPWDRRPGEYSPRECVQDIMRGGSGWAKNEKGVSLIDLQALRINELEARYYTEKNILGDLKTMTKAVSGSDEASSIKDFNGMDKREYLERKQKWENTIRQYGPDTKESSVPIEGHYFHNAPIAGNKRKSDSNQEFDEGPQDSYLSSLVGNGGGGPLNTDLSSNRGQKGQSWSVMQA